MRRVAALLLTLAACAPAAAAAPVLELRVGPHSIAAAADEIDGAAVMESDPPGLSIRVSAAFSEAVGALTGASIGQEAELAICGEVLLRPKIMERISGRNMVITPIPPERLAGLLDVLTGKAACPG